MTKKCQQIELSGVSHSINWSSLSKCSLSFPTLELFCNFLKPEIQQTPTSLINGQMCEGEKVSKSLFSFQLFFFFPFLPTASSITLQTSVTPWIPKVCTIILTYPSIWWLFNPKIPALWRTINTFRTINTNRMTFRKNCFVSSVLNNELSPSEIISCSHKEKFRLYWAVEWHRCFKIQLFIFTQPTCIQKHLNIIGGFTQSTSFST